MGWPGPRSAAPWAGRNEVGEGDASIKNTWTLSELDVAWKGMTANGQPAMAHVLRTSGEARTWVAPGSAEKRQGP